MVANEARQAAIIKCILYYKVNLVLTKKFLKMIRQKERNLGNVGK